MGFFFQMLSIEPNLFLLAAEFSYLGMKLLGVTRTRTDGSKHTKIKTLFLDWYISILHSGGAKIKRAASFCFAK